MTLTNIINQGKEKFYDIIYKGAAAFPYSNDLMHAALIGSLPFLAGKYGSKLLGKKIPFFEKHSTLVGYASSALTEFLWQGGIEPSSPYDNAGDLISDYKGIAETMGGAGLTNLIIKYKNKLKRKEV